MSDQNEVFKTCRDIRDQSSGNIADMVSASDELRAGIILANSGKPDIEQLVDSPATTWEAVLTQETLSVVGTAHYLVDGNFSEVVVFETEIKRLSTDETLVADLHKGIVDDLIRHAWEYSNAVAFLDAAANRAEELRTQRDSWHLEPPTIGPDSSVKNRVDRFLFRWATANNENPENRQLGGR